MEPNVEGIQKAMDFGSRMIPLVLRLRQAKATGTGITLSLEEVRTMVEILQVLRQGPEQK